MTHSFNRTPQARANRCAIYVTDACACGVRLNDEGPLSC
jgi:hypothetical protein